MVKIPIHRIAEELEGEIVKLKYLSKGQYNHAVDYAHRDDYYIFIFTENGKMKLLIDFEEYEIKKNSVFYILPEQVHLLIDHSIDASAWILIVDSSFVKDDYKEIFEKNSFPKNEIELNEAAINDLQSCVSILNRRLNIEKQPIGQHVLYDLLLSYIGIIAEVYQEEASIETKKRAAMITFRFKSLLSVNYQSLKSPSQYAAKMNISSVYLNEAVKKSTGFSVSECIRNEIVIRAKRLLFHTNMNVKEIALELGYEDWAYFTRIFTKASLLSPTQFRAKYLK